MILRSFLSPVTKRHIEQKLLYTPALHLFKIVADVDSYSQFLPLCSHSRVTRRSRQPPQHDDEQRFEAELTVGIAPLFQETYTSLVTANQKKLKIESTSIRSENIDSLHSLWQLRAVDDGQCHVHLEVSMTVRDPVIVAALDSVLERVARQQVQAFSQRCQEVPIDRRIF